ncbi:hypothetical protein ACS386_06175 [Flavobacteriaceae bacterium LMO-SS05]
MAKQKGIIPLVGTLGGINFYFRKGVAVARTAGGGFNAKAIKHSPKMIRVRESNSEFANCSVVNKVFKQAIRYFTEGYVDGMLHSRLMQLFLKIKACDLVSVRGQRQVWQGMTTPDGKHLLKTFCFTPKWSFLFPCAYIFDWVSLRVSITGFVVAQAGFPDGASYMEVRLGAIRFDFETLAYAQVLGTPLVIGRDFAGSTFSLDVPSLPGGNGLAFAMVRVAFYQSINGQPYLLEEGFGLEIVGVEGL